MLKWEKGLGSLSLLTARFSFSFCPLDILGHLHCAVEKYEWGISRYAKQCYLLDPELNRTDNRCTEVTTCKKKQFKSHLEDKDRWESLFTEMMHHEICRKIIIQNTFVICNPPTQWRRKGGNWENIFFECQTIFKGSLWIITPEQTIIAAL